MADDETTTERLVEALSQLIAAAPTLESPRAVRLPDPTGLELDTVDLPRDAFFGPARAVPAGQAVGQVAAEQITPYPPGIPAIVPGERISADVIDYLKTGLQAGMVLPDPADPTLETIRITAGRQHPA
jgi:arginine/lysine/ornithine decarboxylase